MAAVGHARHHDERVRARFKIRGAVDLFSIHDLPFQLKGLFQKPVEGKYPVLLPIMRSDALDRRCVSQQNLHKSPISQNYEPSRKS